MSYLQPPEERYPPIIIEYQCARCGTYFEDEKGLLKPYHCPECEAEIEDEEIYQRILERNKKKKDEKQSKENVE
jgi:DNA-directed RNA polymerase subunit RPC12/RpoP